MQEVAFNKLSFEPAKLENRPAMHSEHELLPEKQIYSD